ncbi:MAG TPA: polyphosphate kinase 2 family protein [Puia sp.]|jgi:PPK2 family polyphosphate:nucleotide phosphotransferase|nr:polyphosphate kinase 2 family protein [Puia sp.]
MTIDPKIQEYLKDFRVKPGKEINLKKYSTDYDHEHLSKTQCEQILENGIHQLAALQDKLYANNRYSVLVIIQGMDAAGKDSVISHVMSGLNPQGVKVTSFKVPTLQELSHDFLWRHYIALPGRGEIGIFNRSHYENVLITRVHPEFILNEKLPGIDDLKKIDQSFWDRRFKEINEFEKTISDNGTIVLKFFLHVSKKEQKKRFLERIDNPSKNWKFSVQDLKERTFWKDYRHAYEDMLAKTSQEYAPWFILPADDKWFTRLAIAWLIYEEFEKLALDYPVVTKDQKAALEQAKQALLKEGDKESINENEPA